MKILAVHSLLMLLFCALSHGGPSIPVEHSRSPDGRVGLSIIPTGSEGVASGDVLIQEVKSGKVLGKFDWFGFGSRADSTAFKVIWREDSRFFAINWAEARGWMTSAVYGRKKNGNWAEVKLPKEDYTKRILQIGGVESLYGKGCDSPEKWLSNGDLLIKFVDRNLCYDQQDLEKEFIVDLRVADRTGAPLDLAKIVAIKQMSKEETERRLIGGK